MIKFASRKKKTLFFKIQTLAVTGKKIQRKNVGDVP